MAFDATIVAIDYAAPADQLVLALKFGGQLALASMFSKMLYRAMLRERAARVGCSDLPDVLTAVPLSAQRLRQRGFNQALEIAKPFAHMVGIPLQHDLVRRQRDTLPQTELLDLFQRRRNVRQAFTVSPTAIARIRDRHIGVVDDVMTTGETLHEIAKRLRHYGARRVTNFVFARTLPK